MYAYPKGKVLFIYIHVNILYIGAWAGGCAALVGLSEDGVFIHQEFLEHGQVVAVSKGCVATGNR